MFTFSPGRVFARLALWKLIACLFGHLLGFGISAVLMACFATFMGIGANVTVSLLLVYFVLCMPSLLLTVPHIELDGKEWLGVRSLTNFVSVVVIVFLLTSLMPVVALGILLFLWAEKHIEGFQDACRRLFRHDTSILFQPVRIAK
jgi:hypothetical protein